MYFVLILCINLTLAEKDKAEGVRLPLQGLRLDPGGGRKKTAIFSVQNMVYMVSVYGNEAL